MLLESIILSGVAYTLLKPRSVKKEQLPQQSNKAKALDIPTKSLELDQQLSSAEVSARKQQYVAAGALGLAGIGAVSYHIITIAALPLVAYGCFQILKEIRDAYRQKSSMMVSVFDGVTLTLALVMVSPLVVAFMLLVLSTSRRLVARTEREVQIDFSRVFGELSATAWLLKEGVEIETPLADLQPGDIIVVHAGGMIPVDGHIVVGEGMLDQHLLTGEFQPLERKVGDAVFTSTLLISATVHVQVEKQGGESITGQIAKSLEHASRFRQQVQSRGNQIVEKGAARTMLASGAALPFVGFGHAVALTYSGFGYQMRAAAPLMIFNYLRLASKNGVLVKDGRALDKFHSIDTVVFDKTGTLTEEAPCIARISACEGFSTTRLLQIAASAEQRQEHPVGLAICRYAEQQNIGLLELKVSDYAIGHGLRAELVEPVGQQQSGTITVMIGSRRFIESAGIAVPETIESMQEEAAEQGHSVVYVASGQGELMGAIEVSPVLRSQARETIRVLHELNIKTCIISGDQERPTRNLANELGIDQYFAETLPEDKADIVNRIQSEGHKVCFVGDGINDSVALQKADVSVSLQGAATIAQDVADIVLKDPDLLFLPYLIGMPEELHRRMDCSELLNNAAGIGCVSGVLIFGMGLGGAVLLYSGGILVNLANSMLPLVSTRETTQCRSISSSLSGVDRNG